MPLEDILALTVSRISEEMVVHLKTENDQRVRSPAAKVIYIYLSKYFHNTSGIDLPIYQVDEKQLKKQANYFNFFNKKKNTLPPPEQASKVNMQTGELVRMDLVIKSSNPHRQSEQLGPSKAIRVDRLSYQEPRNDFHYETVYSLEGFSFDIQQINLMNLLGEGSTGKVYHVLDMNQRSYAIKPITSKRLEDLGYLTDPEEIRRAVTKHASNSYSETLLKCILVKNTYVFIMTFYPSGDLHYHL